jgi:glutathione synthase/RimK-type ligase-like ATP-grasp enzyme
LFLTAIAPIRPLSCDAVGSLVYRACRRADVARVVPHALRRTLATETLHAGQASAFLASSGVRLVPVASVADLLPEKTIERFGRPVVFKERRGAAGKGVSVAGDVSTANGVLAR